MANQPDQSLETPTNKAADTRSGTMRFVLVLFLLGVAAGGAMVWGDRGKLISSLISPTPEKRSQTSAEGVQYIAFEDIVISLGPTSQARHLLLTCYLVIDAENISAVEPHFPRFLDMFNSYLSALNESDFQQPASLGLLRMQMHRRAQIVAGDVPIHDLLITKFVMQ